MSREELIKSACSIISKQAKIWGTWGVVFASHLQPNLEYVFPLVAMTVGPILEGDNLAKFVLSIGNKTNGLEVQPAELPKEWDEFVKSTLIKIKDVKRDEQISIASDIFIDAYNGNIKALADAELYIEIILEMSRKEIEFLGCLYKYFASLETDDASLSIVDFKKMSYTDKDMIHPLLNRLIAKGVVVNSTVVVDEEGSDDENIDISLNEDTFYPTTLGYAVAEYLMSERYSGGLEDENEMVYSLVKGKL